MSEEIPNDCPACGRELIAGMGHTWTWNGTTKKGHCFELPERIMEAFEAYDLQAPARSIYDGAFAAKPLWAALPGRPETHAERMARTDRQLEEERRQRALQSALATARVEWARVRAHYEARNNTPARIVLDIHKPVVVDDLLRCEECSDQCYRGEISADWECETYLLLKDLAF